MVEVELRLEAEAEAPRFRLAQESSLEGLLMVKEVPLVDREELAAGPPGG